MKGRMRKITGILLAFVLCIGTASQSGAVTIDEAEKKAITEDVNKYKESLKLFSDKIKESAVLNNNLAKYVKLISENTTTKDEKLSILRRFSNQGNSIDSSNKLYESINKRNQ